MGGTPCTDLSIGDKPTELRVSTTPPCFRANHQFVRARVNRFIQALEEWSEYVPNSFGWIYPETEFAIELRPKNGQDQIDWFDVGAMVLVLLHNVDGWSSSAPILFDDLDQLTIVALEQVLVAQYRLVPSN